MTKEEFEKSYIKESDITRKFYDENFVTLPCSCDYEKCQGWACVSNNELSIKNHMRNG